MADLALQLPRGRRRATGRCCEAGAAILGVAFLVKAGMWPLSFWLPATYAAASAPVAALFAMLTKVGVYAVLRLWLLLFGAEAGASAGFGARRGWSSAAWPRSRSARSACSPRRSWRGWPATACSCRPARCSPRSAIGQPALTGAALFYLVGSTLGIARFFLLIELVERGAQAGRRRAGASLREAFGDA